METKMNLFLKLVELKHRVEGFYKDAKSFGYSYVSGAQVQDKINPIMYELKLLFLPKNAKHRGWSKHEYLNKKSEEMLDFIVEGDLDYFWVNAENPEEKWEINWQYYGAQNDISKAFGSALTYSERYLLLKSLGLPTDEEDPDSRDTSGKTTKKTTQPQPRATYEAPTPETPIPTTTLEEQVLANKTKFYKLIITTLVNGIKSNELDNHAKGELAKRVLLNYITKELRLNFDQIEFVSNEGQKLLPNNIEIVVGEVIDICANKIEQELAIINSSQEEGI